MNANAKGTLTACGGGKVVCKSLNEAACSTDSKIAKEVCDGQDNDCDGASDELACDDSNKCPTDACDAATGKCSTTPAVNGDDGNQCTQDSCSPSLGTCSQQASSGSCDDGDLCTVGDTCKLGPTGLPQCVTGAAATQCDDGNQCPDDGCAASSGCTHLPNAATATCYTGPAKTGGVGTCKSGLQLCKDGLLTATCVGEVLPNKSEVCDGMDDTCNGLTDEICSASTVPLGFVSAGAVNASSGPIGPAPQYRSVKEFILLNRDLRRPAWIVPVSLWLEATGYIYEAPPARGWDNMHYFFRVWGD